ncbi:MAG TPA: N-formylglutamate amidohydrolase [Caulobacteraceae bacterium]|nr:N-formylglutamate amidohydrolase [Caulobacteraceae bacterium]
MDPASSSPPLLERGDPAPFSLADPGGDSPFLIVVDHAGRAIPRALRDLGLPNGALDLHIAYDLGAAGLALRLGGTLGAAVIAQVYSRLVIDCNRAPGQAGSILDVSDGVAIPGNVALTAAGAAARAQAIHAPYHRRIGEALTARAARGLRTVLLCQHSFTPAMSGVARPWHVGVLHLGDSAISAAMLALLRAEGDLVVGDNEPYAMDGTDFTAPFHARAHGCEMLELEVRQDLIAEPAGQEAMAARLAPLLEKALALSVSGPR